MIVKKQKKEIILRKNQKDRYILYLELEINFNQTNRMTQAQSSIDNTIKLKVKTMRKHSKMYSLKIILQISTNPSKILIFTIIMKKMREIQITWNKNFRNIRAKTNLKICLIKNHRKVLKCMKLKKYVSSLAILKFRKIIPKRQQNKRKGLQKMWKNQ